MKDNEVFIKHILNEINFLIEKRKDLEFKNFIEDETLKRAFVRSLEIIGEASKNISMDFRKKHQEIEWKELAGLRDKLIHHYFGLNWDRIWDIIENLIPKLKEKIGAILQNFYVKDM